MGFNPVKRIRERACPSTTQAGLAETLRSLADLPPQTSTPYLTVSLDWRPAGSDPQQRPAIRQFEHEVRSLHQAYWPRGGVYDSLGTDIERIRSFLADDVDVAVQGIFIVANAGANVFETVTLSLPLATSVRYGPVPTLMHLARLDEDHPTFAVLLADQHKSTVSIIDQSRRVELLDLQSSDYPRKQQSGGWSQRRFQQRADERFLALVRKISTATEEFLDRRGVETVILAGDELMTGGLQRVMTARLRQRVAGVVRLDNESTEREILEATMPIAERAEHEREMNAVLEVKSLLSGNPQYAAAGSEAVIEALVNANVRTLVMTDDYLESGWVDFAHNRYGVGKNSRPFSSVMEEFEAVPIEVQEELVRLAIKTNAEIEIIHSQPLEGGNGSDMELVTDAACRRSTAASELDEFGGVAAVLRFPVAS